MRYIQTVLTTSIFVSILPITAVAQEQQQPRFPNTPAITVVGYAHEIRVPDEVTVVIAATAAGTTSDEALKLLGPKVKAIIATVEAGNITEKETQSSGPFTEILYKHFYDQGGREIYEKRQPNGYRANFTLTIKTKTIDAIGALLPKVTAAEGLVNSISFAVSDARDVMAKLEEQAISNAVTRAKHQIAAAGSKPGRVLQIGAKYTESLGEADLNRPAHIEPYVLDFSFALRPGQEDISVERQVVVEMLPE